MTQVLANATASRFEGVEIAEDSVDLAAAWLAGELDEAAFDADVDQRIADLARPGRIGLGAWQGHCMYEAIRRATVASTSRQTSWLPGWSRRPAIPSQCYEL